VPFLYVFTFNRLEIAIIAMQNLSNGVNVIREGAPSRIRMVLLISLGITTRPRSSILRTIPVAFICINLLFVTARCFLPSGAKNGIFYPGIEYFRA